MSIKDCSVLSTTLATWSNHQCNECRWNCHVTMSQRSERVTRSLKSELGPYQGKGSTKDIKDASLDPIEIMI